MTTFTENDGIVYASVKLDNENSEGLLTGPQIRELLLNEDFAELKKHMPPNIYISLIRCYDEYKAKMREGKNEKVKITDEERLQILRERLRKQTGKY